MKNNIKNIFLFILFSLSGLGKFSGFAQVFPVQMTPVFNSPYSSKISDYSTSLDTKFQLIVNPTDISITNRQVRFKIYIQGNGINAQSNDFVTGLTPVFINGGDLITLTNVDLAALFRLENLQGISAVQYANPLPEGIYSFCFEMYDFVTNQRISQKSCANIYLMLNDPPLLNLPARNEQIAVTDFPNILFTWTPRQINATNVSYKFELKEIQDPNIDPQFGFAMSPLLYEETLFATALNYDLGKPNLLPNKRYAWRVRAISTGGLSENAVFKNDGYSEIFWFKYANNCLAPTFVLSEAISAKSVKITWQGSTENTKYHVQYRKKNVTGAEWFSVHTLNQQTIITNLEANVEYEFRVGASCEPAVTATAYTYSGINSFTMPAEGSTTATYSCGINPTVAIANQTPITNLIVSETFTAGDFPVKVLELTGNSPYSGKGYIVVPYLADTKIAVQFNNVTINTAYQLINGVVETTYNPDWVNVGDIEDVVDDGTSGHVTQTVPFVVTNITINPAGDIVVNGASGQQVTIPGGHDTVITDSQGNVYSVDSQGNVTGPYAPAPGGAPTPTNTDGVSTLGQVTQFTAQGVKVKFKALTEAKYAFDVMPASAPESIKNQYKKVGTIPLTYKAVVNGEEDKLLAEIEITDLKIKLKDIVFKTQNGVLVKADTTGGKSKILLTVKGSLTYAEEEVLATIKQGDKYKVAGAFKLVHISAKEMNVVLLPLNNQSIPATAKNELENVYKTVGIKVNITTGDNITQTGTKITVGNSDFLATYTDDEKAINNKIKALPNYKGNAYYLVYSKLPPSVSGVQGFMPLAGQFGYVFPNASTKTPSHELGHGALGLEHPIKNQTNDQQTGWLMDYGTGKMLSHLDWKQINDPKFRLYNFQGDSEGEIRENDGIDLLGNIISKVDINESVTNTTLVGTLSNEIPFLRTGYFEYTKDNKETPIHKYEAFVENNKVVYKEKTANGSFKTMPYPITVVDKGNALIAILNDGCTYSRTTIYNWSKPENTTSSNITSLIEAKIASQKPKWTTIALFKKEASCRMVNSLFELVKNDKETTCPPNVISADVAKLNELLNKSNYTDDELVALIVDKKICLAALRQMSWNKLKKAFIQIGSLKTIKEKKEVCLLRLMAAINSDNYKDFIEILEDNSNALLLNLIKEVDDKSINPFDGNNFTSFIGGLSAIYSLKPTIWQERIKPFDNKDLLGQVVSLSPFKFDTPSQGSVMDMLLIPLNQAEFRGKLNEATKKIEIDRYLYYIANSVNNTIPSVPSWSKDTDFETVSLNPLDPVIVVTKNNLPLVTTAINGLTPIAENIYVVPAIFLEYKTQKEFNDVAEKGAMITLDVVTIATSGGVALAAKVGWARRIWAITEVAGAVGNITLNSGAVDANTNFGKAIGYYNVAMGIIGVKNGAVGLKNIVINLPTQTKNILKNSGNLRELFLVQYTNWKVATTNLDNFTPAERQLIAKQEKIWKELEVADNVVNGAMDAFDEFLTVGGKVKKAGNKSNLFNSFSDVDNTNIPYKYLSNEQRFNNLAKA